jgi:predicted ArsR family transcriptional regulator
MEPTSTRKVILNLLKVKGALSVNDLARELKVTEMAVRRHMNTLERDGLIDSRLMRQAMGRPTRVYSLTDLSEELFPKKYHFLALELLGELEKEEGADQVTTLFERRRNMLFDKYLPRMQGKNLEQRVSELAEIQDANGYMVEWEKDGAGGFILKEFNCPISRVANRYPQACQCELALFERLLGTDVTRTECLAKGGRHCCYLIPQQQAENGTYS